MVVKVPFFFLVPSAPPQALTVSTVTLSNSSGINVSWQPPPAEMQNGIIQEYRVRGLDNVKYGVFLCLVLNC